MSQGVDQTIYAVGAVAAVSALVWMVWAIRRNGWTPWHDDEAQAGGEAGVSVGDCRSCGHPIGYHHEGTEQEMLCTVLDCDCPGYDDEDLPRVERLKPVEKPD